MKLMLIGAVAASALLGVSAQAAPLSKQANLTEAAKPAAVQKVDWYGHHRYWRDRYWHHRYWREHYWR